MDHEIELPWQRSGFSPHLVPVLHFVMLFYHIIYGALEHGAQNSCLVLPNDSAASGFGPYLYVVVICVCKPGFIPCLEQTWFGPFIDLF